MATKGVFQPKKLKRLRKHGFMARMATIGGQKVIKRRRAKGNSSLAL